MALPPVSGEVSFWVGGLGRGVEVTFSAVATHYGGEEAWNLSKRILWSESKVSAVFDNFWRVLETVA